MSIIGPVKLFLATSELSKCPASHPIQQWATVHWHNACGWVTLRSSVVWQIFLCCGTWEEPLLSMYVCLREASVVISPIWKYTNFLCVLVLCSLVPAGYNSAQCSQRKTIAVCLHWTRRVTVHSECAHTPLLKNTHCEKSCFNMWCCKDFHTTKNVKH